MYKILVVDDEPNVRNVLKQMIEKRGYIVKVAENGADAIEKFKKEDFDLVVTDIKMPILDGFHVLTKVKELKPKTPVIFITAYGAKEVVIEAMKLGLSDYIEKPFNMAEVLEIIEKQLK